MAKRQTDERHPPDEQRAPEHGSASGYNAFLKVEHLSDQPMEFALTGWTRRTIGKFGPQIVVELLTLDGRTFDWGIKEGSPNHRMLFRGMGRDETKWKGSVTLEVQTFKFAGGRKSNPAIGVVEVIPE